MFLNIPEKSLLLETFQESDVEIQEDGSALLGPAPEMQMTSEFSENLAEILPDSELGRIYIDLILKSLKKTSLYNNNC